MNAPHDMEDRMEDFDGARVPLTRGTTLIEASAGTGKTYSIATLYLRLVLEENVAVDRILAVTYTEAATKELIGRIRQRLYNAQRALEEWQRSGSLPGDPPEPVLVARLEASCDVAEDIRRLSRAVQLFDEAMISTIHGFCYRALREYAFESGSRYSAELVGESQELYDQVASDFWRCRICTASPLVASLALATGYSDLSRWQSLLKIALKPANFLPDITTPPAEEPLLAHLHAITGYWRKDRSVICELLGETSGVRQCDKTYRADRLEAFAAALDLLISAGEDALPPDALHALGMFRQTKIDASMKKGKTPPTHPFFAACDALHDEIDRFFLSFRRLFLSEAVLELERLKREQNVLLFDDLLRVFHDALTGPGGERLRSAVARRFDAVLIDEFQDTDPLQAAIFGQLFGRGDHALFLIGDPKQAIYAFRGADLHAYLTAAGLANRRFGLPTNWRSDAPLLAAMNALFTHHPAPFLEERIHYRPISAAPKNAAGREPEAPLLFRQIPGENLPRTDAQARVISDLVAEVKCRRSQYAFGEMAVLVRNHTEAAAVQSALMASGIPAIRQTRESVYNSGEAAQLQVILEAVVEPQQAGRVARALLIPLFAEGLEADEVWIARFVDWRTVWRAEGFMAMWQRLLGEVEGRRRLLEHPQGERRLTNFLHLAELIHQEETERKLGPESLTSRFRLLRNSHADGNEAAQLRLESDAEAVQVVTIHRSKGLEYPLVFAPFLWRDSERKTGSEVEFHDAEGQLCIDLRGADAPEAHRTQAQHERSAEELRLLYVAVTRARHCCIIHHGDISGYATSPLGHLLPDPAALESLARRCPEGIALERVDEAAAPPAPPPPPEAPATRGARVFSRALVRTAFTTSFTGLTRGAPAEAPERDEPMETAPEEESVEPAGIHAFAKGARAGDFIHDLMESVPFAAEAREERRALIAGRLALYGFPTDPWLDVLEDMITAALNAELAPGLTLTALPERDRLVEVDFSCRLPSLTPGHLLSLAQRFPGELNEREFARLQFSEVQGFLRGAIDLFFHHAGRYYLLDWKSNWLGRSAAAYTPARMQAAMRQHHYGLQAHLYTLAADRYLRLRLPGYDYEEHFGGVFYLFLRGIGSGGNGIVPLRPSAGLVAAMREWMEEPQS